MTTATNENGNSLLLQGRIVWTSGKTLFEGNHKKDQMTKQPLFDNKTGAPIVEYGFGLAVPKFIPGTTNFTPEYVKAYQALHGEALTLYPSGQLPPGFALKYKDGDGVDHEGKPFNTREGYAGHIVIACTTRIPIKFFRFEGGNNLLVNDGIKCGDYVNVQLNIKAHPAHGQGKPGLYVNPTAVQLIQAGKEIINTPSGDQMFGTQAPSYSGPVVAPQAAPMPNIGGAPQAPMAPQMPQQGYAPQAPAQPMAPAPSHYNVVPEQFQPQAPAQPMMPQQGYAPQAPAQPMMPPQYR